MSFCNLCHEIKFKKNIEFGNCECIHNLNCCNMSLILNTIYTNKKCNICSNKYNKYQLKKIENYLKIINFSLEITDYEILFHNMNEYYQELIKETFDYIYNYHTLSIDTIHYSKIEDLIKIYLDEDFIEYFLEKYNFVKNKYYEII